MGRRMVCPSTGKRIYWNESTANKAISSATRHNVFLKHYKCKKCGYYHCATNKKKREKPDESLPS